MTFGVSNPNDPRSQLRGAPPRLPFSRVGPLGMIVLLVAVVLAMVFAGRVANAPEETPPDQPDRIVREPKVEFVPDEDLPRLDPEGIAKETEDTLAAWYATPGRRQIDDRSDDLEPEWLLRFGEDDVRNALVNLPPHAFRELEERDRVRAEPGGRRGRLVSVLCEVTSVDAIEIPGASGPRPAWRMRAVDDRKDPWVVVSVVEPTGEVAPGRWIRVSGVFAKLAPAPGGTRDGGKDGGSAFVVHTSQPVLPSFPPPSVPAIDPSWAASIDDSTYEASQSLPGSDGDAFWLLCAHLRAMGPEGYAAKVRAGELRPETVEDMSGPAQRPKDFRMKLLRVRLAPSIRQFVMEGVQRENPGHVRDVWRGFAADDKGRNVQILSPFPASAFPVKEGVLVVWAEGYFYKRRAVELRDKPGSAYWMPVFVATRMTVIDPYGKSVVSWATVALWIVLVSVPLLVTLWIVLSRKAAREREAAVARHAQRMAERQRRGVTTGEGGS